MGEFNEKKTTCGTVCLKYLLFTFNCCFWLAGLAVMAVGIWTLALKSDYISLLASGTYLATAYILVVAGVVVMVTGVLGCCATFKERRNLLRLYFILLLIIFLLEIIAGVLAYVYYQQLNAELKENLKDTMTKRYHQKGHEGVTSAVDKLQQEFHCCGSNNSQDWRDSEWIRSGEAGGRVVPDSCCKTVVAGCGQRDHASNIYKVEVGWQEPGAPEPPDAGGWCGYTPREAGAVAMGGAGGLANLQRPTPTLPGRLHQQAGDLHPGAPEDHRGCGHRHRLCAGVGRRAGCCGGVQGREATGGRGPLMPALRHRSLV
uniref:CD151 molecule (Raph blood group) n=1 Tax=Equus asinus asinus TaxID=83772 RepID=A0A8C4PJM2_EQUAS